MRLRRAPRGAALVACVAALVAGCGKRGDPLPPLRPVPAGIADLAVRRTADRVDVSLTVPAANADGTTPAAVDRVDVYARSLPADAPPPTAAQLAGDPANLIARIMVREPAPASPAAPPASPAAPAAAPGSPAAAARPTATVRPGEIARVVDTAAAETASNVTRYFTAVAVAGTGAGRPGPAAPVLSVPLGALPAPPVSVSLTHDETDVILSWQPAAAAQRFRVLGSGEAFEGNAAGELTPAPIDQASYRVPVSFGREFCFRIVPIAGEPPVTVEGDPSPAQCVAPTDTYPPAAPTGLQALAGSDAVTLVWTAVMAPDLAGYVVVRGVAGEAGELQPLFAEPIAATSYRDAAVQPGVTYTYAVYAVDRAPTPNLSPRSAPQVVTVR